MSGDRCDVVFDLGELGYAVVEIEDGQRGELVKGINQAVKYRALMEAEKGHGEPVSVSLTPVAFTDAFGGSADKQIQWAAFLRRQGIQGAPSTLLVIVRSIAKFLDPLLCTVEMGHAFEGRWHAGGSWA